MENKIILVDVDQTVLHFADHFEEWMRRKQECPPGKLGVGWSIEKWLSISSEAKTKLIEEFSEDLTEMGNLRAEEHAVEGIQTLSEQGWRFVAITACHDAAGIREARWSNLEAVFGPVWEALHITGLSGSKDDILKSYPPTVWVEDSVSHAIAGAEIGHRTFLIDHPYNQGEFKGVTRVNDWRDIAEALSGE